MTFILPFKPTNATQSFDALLYIRYAVEKTVSERYFLFSTSINMVPLEPRGLAETNPLT